MQPESTQSPSNTEINDTKEIFENLYQSYFSTPAYFGISHKQQDIRYLPLVDQDKKVNHLIAYKILNKTLYIMNEVFSISPEQLDKISQTLFEQYPNAKKIVCNAVQCNHTQLLHPCRLSWDQSMYVLDIPASFEDYKKKLSTKTRQHIQNGYNKSNRELAPVQQNFYLKKDITSEVLNEIAEIYSDRMKAKKKNKTLKEPYLNRIRQLLPEYGMVATLSLNNETASAILGFRVKNTLYINILTHRDKFNRYSPGLVLLFKTIEWATQNHIKKINLLWGDQEYKTKFQSNKIPVRYIIIYRNHTAKHLALTDLINMLRYKLILFLKHLLTAIRLVKHINKTKTIKNKNHTPEEMKRL